MLSLLTSLFLKTHSFISNFMSEDEVVDAVASVLRGRGFVVLSEGANQGSAFRFQLASGRYKAPDLVVYRANTLVVMEAKIRPKDLFSSSRVGESDFEALNELAGNQAAQKKLALEAQRRLEHSGNGLETIHSIYFGVIAAGSCIAAYPPLEDSPFAAVSVSKDARSCTLERTNAHWALGVLL